MRGHRPGSQPASHGDLRQGDGVVQEGGDDGGVAGGVGDAGARRGERAGPLRGAGVPLLRPGLPPVAHVVAAHGGDRGDGRVGEQPAVRRGAHVPGDADQHRHAAPPREPRRRGQEPHVQHGGRRGDGRRPRRRRVQVAPRLPRRRRPRRRGGGHGHARGGGGGGGGGGSYRFEVRSFEMSFHRRHKDKAIASYLPHILAEAKKIKDQDRTLKIYMNEGESWFAIDLHHPSTFTTLAMDRDMKRSVMDDLERFVRRKEYYKRIGKAWKRGYLLHGPPGTGKSSLIAAMANYLKFDVYDLELTEVNWNSTLRRLLIGMTNRSILVIEDIDCSVDLQQRAEEGQDGGTKSSPPPSEDKVINQHM